MLGKTQAGITAKRIVFDEAHHIHDEAVHLIGESCGYQGHVIEKYMDDDRSDLLIHLVPCPWGSLLYNKVSE